VSIYHRCMALAKMKVCFKVHNSCLWPIFLIVLEDLSALVVHDRSQDISGPMPDLEGEVVTLTHLPRSRWETLLNLDVIQVGFYKLLAVLFTLTHSLNSDN
jgi:hypothetical protein